MATTATSLIADLYIALLGRAPDAAGLAFWSTAAATMSTVELAAAMLSSDEAAAIYGGADGDAVIARLYQTTLGRAPDADALAFWKQVLDANGGKVAQLAASFVAVLETDLPATRPDGMSDADYAQAVADRATFGNKREAGLAFAESGAGASIDLAARAIAGIDATPESLAAAQARIEQGASPLAAELYVALLGRAPDAEGLAFWTAQIEAGLPVSALVASILGSDEAAAGIGAATSADAFIEALYLSAFGRAADADGKAFWLGALRAAGDDAAARASIAADLIAAAAASQGASADRLTLANKVEAGLYFAASAFGKDLSIAKDAIADVTADPATVDSAKDLIDHGGVVPGNPGTPETHPTAPITYTNFVGATEGASDASTAIALADGYMLVGDDEAGVVRIYHRDGGAAVKEISLAAIGMGDAELDLESATRVGDTIYFIGSHGNGKSGGDQPNREWIAAYTVSGTGAATELAYQGSYTGLVDALAAWDNGNAHGLGAGFFGIEAAAAAGSPEQTGGFGIEGLTTSADGDLWIAFRAPVTGGAEQRALIVPIENIDAVLSAGADPIVGDAIRLDLGGRGIREIVKNANGDYLIIAGPSGPASDAVADDFRLYGWDGSVGVDGVATHLMQYALDLDALLQTTAGSFESIVNVPDVVGQGAWVQLLQDNGDTIWTGQTQVSKDLDPADQKFVGNWVQLGAVVGTDTKLPTLTSITPADGAIGVTKTSLVELLFDEPVRAGDLAGTAFTLIPAGGGEPIALTLDSTLVRFEYNKVILDLTSLFVPGEHYALTVAGGAIVDASNNAFGGTDLDFTIMPEGTLLGAGDIAFVGVNSKAAAKDAFAFVLLTDVAAGTSIHFTDKEWLGDAFDTKESDLVWTTGSVLHAGTVITIQPNGNGVVTDAVADIGVVTGEPGGLGDEGEQLFAFTGTVSSPGTFLAAIGFGAAGGLVTANPQKDVTSLIPQGLALGTNAVNVTVANAVYDGPFSGTKAELLAAISDAANWVSTGGASAGNAIVDDAMVIDSPFHVAGPTLLEAGDLVFVAMGTDGDDPFAFMLTTDIGEGTVIGFTDRDYAADDAAASLASGEAAYTWTADKAYGAGTVITILPKALTASDGFLLGEGGGLSADGETLYAFQGHIADLASGTAGAVSVDRFIAAITATAAGDAASGDTPNGVTMQTITHDNGYFSGDLANGDIAGLAADILDSANWAESDGTQIVVVGGEVQFPA